MQMVTQIVASRCESIAVANECNCTKLQTLADANACNWAYIAFFAILGICIMGVVGAVVFMLVHVVRNDR